MQDQIFFAPAAAATATASPSAPPFELVCPADSPPTPRRACQPIRRRFCRARHAEGDLCIAASAHDFVRLAMEGGTELGLVVKNTLDALELPVLDPQKWAPRPGARP